MIIEVRRRGVKRGRACGALDLRELSQVGVEYVAIEDQVGALALADDLDQAGRLQLLDVMRDGRGAHAVGFAPAAEWNRAMQASISLVAIFRRFTLLL